MNTNPKRAYWVPWDIQTSGPPCVKCFYWRPQFKYITVSKQEPIRYIPDGIVCCQRQEMFHDFSCFKEKDNGG